MVKHSLTYSYFLFTSLILLLSRAKMDIYKGFFDLCVPYNKDEAILTAVLEELYKVGYRTVAIDQTFDHTKCSRKGAQDIFPDPVNISNIRTKFQDKPDFKILQRLSIVYTHSAVSHDMNISLNIKKFNLICGIPTSDPALQHACSTFAGDLIGLYHNDTVHVNLIGHKFYQMAARRGIFFEIPYAPMIQSTTHRKDLIILGQNFVSHKKAETIVITGGALNSFQVRGPYDVANLGLIFGLREEQSKSAISSISRNIVLRAEGRRHGKTLILATNISSAGNDDDEDSDPDEYDSDDVEMDAIDSSNVELKHENDSNGCLTELPSKKQKISESG